MTTDKTAEIKGRAESSPSYSTPNMMIKDIRYLLAENERLRDGCAEILDGLVSGEVGGEDVVWFNKVITLYDHISGFLDPDQTADMFPGHAPSWKARAEAAEAERDALKAKVAGLEEEVEQTAEDALSFTSLQAAKHQRDTAHAAVKVLAEAITGAEHDIREVCGFLPSNDDGCDRFKGKAKSLIEALSHPSVIAALKNAEEK